jgi:hypothetical protein
MKLFPSWTTILRRVCLPLAVAATIAAAAIVEEGFRGERAWRQFAKECADEGKPLDYAFYKPASIPDDQNLFKTPVLARFFNGEESAGKAWGAYERGKPPLSEMQNIIGNWRQGRPSDLEAVYGILGKAPKAGSGGDRKAAAGLILEQLGAYKPELDEMCDAARIRPQAQIAFGDSFLGQFPAMRTFGRALVLRSVAELELGRSNDAFNDMYASLRFAEGVGEYPSFVHLMMSNVMMRFSIQPVWEGCRAGVWSEGQLEAIQGILSRFHPLRELPTVFPATRAAYATGLLGPDSRKPRWMPEGWWKLNVVRLFQSRAAGGDPLAVDPALERIDLNEIERADARVGELSRSHSPLNWLVRNEKWAPHFILNVAAGYNGDVIACTACALERYRLVRGRYPAELSGLVPSFLQSVPLDVIDGAPLRYECGEGNQFRLYSIGLSGVDSHSSLIWPNMDSWSTKEGYWAWTQPVRQ